jgi:hypothetical protein
MAIIEVDARHRKDTVTGEVFHFSRIQEFVKRDHNRKEETKATKATKKPSKKK